MTVRLAPDRDTDRVTDPVQAYRDAMSQLAAGVSLVTLHTDEPEDDHGMTVTSLVSASLHPPMVTVGVGSGTSMAPMLKVGLAAGVSVFAHDQRDLAAVFARSGRPPASVLLRDVPHHRAPSGALLLDEALATLEARISAVVPAGDHFVALLEVLHSTARGVGAPLVYHRRGYL